MYSLPIVGLYCTHNDNGYYRDGFSCKLTRKQAKLISRQIINLNPNITDGNVTSYSCCNICFCLFVCVGFNVSLTVL